jgi:hypothetical protein
LNFWSSAGTSRRWADITLGAESMSQMDKKSWAKGRADAMRGAPLKCPKSLDPLAYTSGYVEGQAHQAEHPLHVIQGHAQQAKHRPLHVFTSFLTRPTKNAH